GWPVFQIATTTPASGWPLSRFTTTIQTPGGGIVPICNESLDMHRAPGTSPPPNDLGSWQAEKKGIFGIKFVVHWSGPHPNQRGETAAGQEEGRGGRLRR